MNARLRAILAYDNDWLTGGSLDEWYRKHLPERYIPRSARLAPDDRVCLVIGPRQVGKSTLIWKTLADGGGPALLLSCEEPAIAEWLSSPAAFLADVRDLVPSGTPLLFEEVQALPEAGRVLKGVVDRRAGHPLFATGSSSFDLEDRTRESLAGRAERVLLLPFTFDELAADRPAPPVSAPEANERLLGEMLVWGSYPRVVTASTREAVLAKLIESFVIRDASDRFRIRHVGAFRKIAELAASQTGALVRFAEWASIAGISADTVADYAQILENTHVVKFLRPFVGGRRAELTHAPKAYVVDNGVRNALYGGFAPASTRGDRGALVEAFVCAELAKSTSPLLHGLRYWRAKGGAEVDFVVEHRGRLLACEVKAGGAGGRLTRATRSFLHAYVPELLLVVQSDGEQERTEAGVRVRFIRPWQVARCVREFLAS